MYDSVSRITERVASAPLTSDEEALGNEVGLPGQERRSRALAERIRRYKRDQTPLTTLLSVEDAASCLEPEITLDTLRAEATRQNDTQAAQAMQPAKITLFRRTAAQRLNCGRGNDGLWTSDGKPAARLSGLVLARPVFCGRAQPWKSLPRFPHSHHPDEC